MQPEDFHAEDAPGLGFAGFVFAITALPLYPEPMSEVVQAQAAENTMTLRVTTRRLDGVSAADFKAGFEEAWVEGVRNVTVDLAEVEFIDSSGVEALLTVYRKVAGEGRQGTVRLSGMRSQVRSVVDLLRLHRVFETGDLV